MSGQPSEQQQKKKLCVDSGFASAHFHWQRSKKQSKKVKQIDKKEKKNKKSLSHCPGLR